LEVDLPRENSQPKMEPRVFNRKDDDWPDSGNKSQISVAMGLGFGIAIGAGIGAAMRHVALGIATGVALGVGIGTMLAAIGK
jgi:hypothetical protein